MDLREQLDRDEGTRLTLYRDTKGKLTIGRGHNIQDDGISKAAMEFIFNEDLEEKQVQLSRNLPWTASIDPVRRDALINLCFNMGIGGLLTFDKMLAAAKNGDWITAAQELVDSDYGRGATRFRAARLAKQMIDGVYQ